jgi:two-component system, OmpR family, sensor histidine kinase VicK
LSRDNIAQATGIEIIQDPFAIQKLYNSLVQSAKREILLLLPTTSAFIREEKMGIIQSLHDAADRGIRIKVLTPTDEKIMPKMEATMQDKNNNMGIRRVRYKSDAETSEEARTKILVVDRKAYLVVELKDDSKETFVEAVRLAIHSTTQSTVKSYITLFESLWEQSEIYDKLEAHDKMQREFINVAAHELKTPIQPILISIELLEQEFRNGKEEVVLTKEDLDLLFRNAKRLERLSSAILEVTRIESNSMRLNKEKFDINEKIRNVINDTKGLSLPEKLKIINDTRESIFVEADKLRIFEVISNLVRNAIKFTSEGRIVVKGQKEGNNLLVQVKDTGTGIDPDIKPRLFTKFATKSDQGTGLGLFISKSIVEAHGGRIWAENNPDGRGATFSFTLPLA